MSRVPGILAIVFALLCGALPARAAETAALERGTAITDPATLRELDGGKFRLDRMLLPERSADIPLANSELFAAPSMAQVRQAIDGEFDRYIANHKQGLPNETIGVGDSFDFQLFDRKQLQQVWRVRRALNALSAENVTIYSVASLEALKEKDFDLLALDFGEPGATGLMDAWISRGPNSSKVAIALARHGELLRAAQQKFAHFVLPDSVP